MYLRALYLQLNANLKYCFSKLFLNPYTNFFRNRYSCICLKCIKKSLRIITHLWYWLEIKEPGIFCLLFPVLRDYFFNRIACLPRKIWSSRDCIYLSQIVSPQISVFLQPLYAIDKHLRKHYLYTPSMMRFNITFILSANQSCWPLNIILQNKACLTFLDI